MGRIIKVPLIEPKKRKWELTDPYGDLKEALNRTTKICVKKCKKSESK